VAAVLVMMLFSAGASKARLWKQKGWDRPKEVTSLSHAYFRKLPQVQSDEPCLKSAKTFLDRVSTTCGSGWVIDGLHKTLGNRARLRRTHPLPQVVLTRSKREVW